MSLASLRDIERTLITLYTVRSAREIFLDNASGQATADLGQSSLLSSALLSQVDKKGIVVYANLLKIGQHDLMANVFAGCAKLIGQKWEAVVDDYFEKYPPTHYNLNRSAERFSDYLAKFGDSFSQKFPFIVELADYEWLELEMLEHSGFIVEMPHQVLATPEQFETLRPLVNPVLAIRRYKYAIPKIVDYLIGDCPQLNDIQQNATCVAVYRDPQTDNCRFLEIGEVTAKIIELALETPTSYKDLIAHIIANSDGASPETCVMEFLGLVEKLQDVRLFVGCAPIDK